MNSGIRQCLSQAINFLHELKGQGSSKRESIGMFVLKILFASDTVE